VQKRVIGKRAAELYQEVMILIIILAVIGAIAFMLLKILPK
jgi:hypothetical protein